MEVKRPNTQANDLAMQRLQEQLLNAREEGVEGILTSVNITRPDGSEIKDEDVQIEITGGIDISDKIEETVAGQSLENIENSSANTANITTKDSSLDEIIAAWHQQANFERFLEGTAPEFTNLLNPYQLQGQCPILSFEDLVKLGALFPQSNIQPIAEMSQTSAAQGEAQPVTESGTIASETAQSSTQTETNSTESTKDKTNQDETLINGEENIGSVEFLTKALKSALPDLDISDNLVYYDRLYDDKGRLTEMKKNSIYENMDLPDIKIEYSEGSDEKGTYQTMLFSSTDKDGTQKGLEVMQSGDTIQASVISEDTNNLDVHGYDKKWNCTDWVKTLAAGESCTFRGIQVENPTNSAINVSFLVLDGKLTVDAKGATITAVDADDAIDTDNVLISDGENIKTYKDYNKSSSSSDSDSNSDSDSTSKLTKLNNLTNIINALSTLLNS